MVLALALVQRGGAWIDVLAPVRDKVRTCKEVPAVSLQRVSAEVPAVNLDGQPDQRALGSTTRGSHNPAMIGDHPQAHGAQGGAQGKSAKGEARRGAPKRSKDSAFIRALTINVCGVKPERRAEASNTTPEAGNALMWMMSDKLREVVDQMKQGGIQIGVWADTHLSRDESRTVAHLLYEEGYGCYWTEGQIDETMRTRGVMVVWDMQEVRVREDDETVCEVVSRGGADS